MKYKNQSPNPLGKQAPCLLSTIYGKIEQILLSESGYKTPWTGRKFEAIRKSYETAGIETFILVNKQDRVPRFTTPKMIDLENPVLMDFLARGRYIEISARFNPNRWREDFETIHAQGLPLVQSQWAQDAFCVMQYDERYNVLLQPIYSQRLVDQFVSTELALEPRLSMLIQPTELQVEGGNILVGDDYALIGLNTLGINWVKFLQTEIGAAETQESYDQRQEAEFLMHHLELLKERFKKELGVSEVIWIGFAAPRMALFGHQKYVTMQPVYHLDLFMTLGGKSEDNEEIIFLADPAAGKRIAEEASESTIDAGISWQSTPVADALISSYFDEVESYFRAYNADLNCPRKFKVIRLPLLIEGGVAYSFNNALVEVFEKRKRAFIPNYIISPQSPNGSRRTRLMNEKMEALQTEVENIFRANGFSDIFWTGDGIHLQNFAARMGTLRCVSKVLRRAESRD